MIVMPSNNTSCHVGWLAGRFPGRLGHLYSPGGFRGPFEFLPYALDNGRFVATTKDQPWDEEGFIAMCDKVDGNRLEPRWVVVPDVVGDKDGTLREWATWSERLAGYGWPLAIAVQDGMVPEDVPANAEVIFVGGSTTWKRRTIWSWCEAFSRVHVGRINTERWLWECDRAGVESCDGTGFYRGDKVQLAGMVRYLERSAEGLGERQLRLFRGE